MKKIFVRIRDLAEGKLRGLCAGIEPLDIPDFVPADTLSDKKIREMEEFFNQFNK